MSYLMRKRNPQKETGNDTVPLPTAHDQVAGQLHGLLDRLQSQIKAGLDPALAVETLLALEANNDPIAHLVLNAAEKSATFESWLTWLPSQIGAGTKTNRHCCDFHDFCGASNGPRCGNTQRGYSHPVRQMPAPVRSRFRLRIRAVFVFYDRRTVPKIDSSRFCGYILFVAV